MIEWIARVLARALIWRMVGKLTRPTRKRKTPKEADWQ